MTQTRKSTYILFHVERVLFKSLPVSSRLWTSVHISEPNKKLNKKLFSHFFEISNYMCTKCIKIVEYYITIYHYQFEWLECIALLRVSGLAQICQIYGYCYLPLFHIIKNLFKKWTWNKHAIYVPDFYICSRLLR